MERQINYIDRKFGHSDVKWKIQNFCVLSFEENWEIYSPEFYVRGFQLTKWRMVVKPQVSETADSYLSFKLERLEFNQNSEAVWIDCELHVCTSSNVQGRLLLAAFDSNLTENAAMNVDIRNGTALSYLAHSDNVVLQCKLIVCFNGGVEILDVCSDLGVRKLSEDLEDLYENSENCDLELRMNAGGLLVHKAVLHSRSRFFGRLIDDMDRMGMPVGDNGMQVININFFDDFEAMRCVVGFLYTGNIKYAVDEPSISLYQFSLLTGVTPIIEYYNPDQLHINSTIEAGVFHFTWTISNFFSGTEKRFESPYLVEDITDTTWRLCIDSEVLRHGIEYVVIALKNVKGRMSNDICAYFALKTVSNIDGTIKYVFPRKVFRRMREKDTIEHLFEKSDTLKQNLQDGTLNLFFKFQIFTGRINCSVGDSEISFQTYSVGMNYMVLSQAMTWLYRHSPYSNIALQSGDIILKAHRCILAVRSPSLYDACTADLPENPPTMRAEVLDLLFLFLHCGRFTTSIPSLDDIFDLYDAANEFTIPYLKNLLVKMLQEDMTIEKSKDVFLFADNYDIMNLALFTLRFVRNFLNENAVEMR